MPYLTKMTAFFRARNEHVLFGVVLLLAVVLFAVLVDERLPRVNVDEANLLGEELYIRGEYDSPFYHPGYPPVMRGLYAAAVTAADQLSERTGVQNATPIILGLRVVSVLVNLVNTLLIGVLLCRITSLAFAIVGMLLWIIMPSPVYYALLAESEVYQVFFGLLTLLICMTAIEKKSDWWLGAAALTASCMFAAKYSAFPIFAVPLLATIVTWWGKWRRLAWVMGVQLGIYAVTAFVLFGIYGAGSLTMSQNKESRLFLDSGIHQLLNVTEVQRIFSFQSEFMLFPSVVFVGLVVFVPFVAFVQWRQPARAFVLICAWLLAMGGVWLIVAYLYFEGLLARYSLPFVPLFIIAFVGVLGITADFLAAHFRKRTIRWAGVIVIGWVWMLPNLSALRLALIANSLPVTEQVIADHSALAFPAGSFFGHGDMPEYFHVLSGGYSGIPRGTILLQALEALPPDEWRANFTGFVMLTEAQYAALPAAAPYLTEIWRVPNMTVATTRNEAQQIYWINRDQLQIGAVFGDQITLPTIEYRLTADAIYLRFLWRALATLTDEYALYVHLYPLDGRAVLSQADSTPAMVSYPTTAWRTDEIIISEEIALNMPTDLPDGDYRIAAGLYHVATGQRLLTADGQDYSVLATVRVMDGQITLVP